MPGEDPSGHNTSPGFQPVLKHNHYDILDSEIGEFLYILHQGCGKYWFLGVPNPGFLVALVVQQEVLGVVLVLQKGGVMWAGCVGCIELIAGRSGQVRFLTPCKNQGHRTRRHNDLSQSFHEGPVWIPYPLFYLNSQGCCH